MSTKRCFWQYSSCIKNKYQITGTRLGPKRHGSIRTFCLFLCDEHIGEVDGVIRECWSLFSKLRASFTLLYSSPLAESPIKRTDRHTKWANWYSTRGKCSDTKYLSSTYESGMFSSTHARKWRSNQLSHKFELKVYSFICYQYRTLPHVLVHSIILYFIALAHKRSDNKMK